ncbi:MAG TPA: metallopeptidase TldD-related protein [Verrucomicrobiae bacterium]|nr:metallopeptidase TldD-related protein [Verrucomicrobiae bacterium]
MNPILKSIVLSVCCCAAVINAGAADPAADPLFKALQDEMKRSMSLQLEELASPYFIQYSVDDTEIERVTASYGALTSSGPSRSRTLQALLRVGTMELDNSNFVGGRGFGRRGSSELPLDNDYLALRQAIWRATDGLYKGAVETLTQKRAYLKDHTIEDRPHDFSKATATTAILDTVTLSFDRKKWEGYVRQISDQFSKHRHIQNSEVRLIAGVENRYLVNSEGSRLRYGMAEVSLRIGAESLASDGERMTDDLEYSGRTPAQLPPISTVIADVQRLAERLTAAAKAPVLNDYSGPVLIEGLASPLLFRQLLARGILGVPDPVGLARRTTQGPEDLEKRMGKRILPTTFHVYDDPRPQEFQGTPLAGHYLYDDEGLPAQRVDIVVSGKLQGMLMSRTPTKRFSQSNAHGRRGSDQARAAVGNLFIESSAPKSAADLKKALLKAADDEGLEYGIRIEGLQSRDASDLPPARSRRVGSGRGVGDPVRVYKVYVADGREELVRGCEFRGLDERSMRRILAAGNTPVIDNRVISSTPSSSVIAPAVLFEEIELTKIERESERKPFLPSPQSR